MPEPTEAELRRETFMRTPSSVREPQCDVQGQTRIAEQHRAPQASGWCDAELGDRSILYWATREGEGD